MIARPANAAEAARAAHAPAVAYVYRRRQTVDQTNRITALIPARQDRIFGGIMEKVVVEIIPH